MKWSPLAEKTHQSLIRKTLLKHNDKILLAVSGGVDSVVMLSVFIELQKRWNWELIVGHIDHGLRPGDDANESQLCRELAIKNNLQYVEEKVDLNKNEVIDGYATDSTQNPSIESLARDVRYRVFSKWLKDLRCNAICTAHHANDQAETVLYRMLTGAGIKGLSGIPESRDFIKRPFLPFLRKEIENYARERELKYFEDHSNEDEKFARNKIRHSIIPALKKMGFPFCEKALADSGLVMTEATQVIDHYTKIEIEQVLSISSDEVKLSIKEYRGLPLLIQKQILKNMFKNKLFVSRHISEKQLIQLNTFILSSDMGNSIELLGYKLIKDREHIICKLDEFMRVNLMFLCREGIIQIPESENKLVIKIVDMPKSLISNNSVALFSIELLNRKLQLRTWKSGDTMSIYGSGYTKKLSDILKDEKVNIADKGQQLVLTFGEDVLWIPKVKRSDRYIVNINEDKLVMITYKHGAGK
ncbi:MAG: tRNA lysidine(34) synthetase TilS [Candidatus Marinimicrobia bacterium]|nr:tRNA lysidine(34) synthetase TilS [Candidatus Neomarinimicrobiota bacterium]